MVFFSSFAAITFGMGSIKAEVIARGMIAHAFGKGDTKGSDSEVLGNGGIYKLADIPLTTSQPSQPESRE